MVPVILFHAGFQSFSGGFVGVDVFFVISGYLITSLIVEEVKVGQFSLRRFYERRARRILPALFAVMAVCCVLAWFLVPPEPIRQFGHSLAAVSLFVSNVLFWTESGYFAPAAEEKPLLHTWSLAVEEQFYIFFPLLVFLIWRHGRNHVSAVVAVLALISLVASEWGARHAPGANFYLAPTRICELLLGALPVLAGVGKPGRPAIRQLLSIVGLAMIVVSILAFNEYTPFPGLHALVPTLGTLLILLYALPDTWVGRLLSMRLLVGIGLISYSAYLWHQPLLAFIRLDMTEPLSSAGKLAIVAVTMLLAWLSWRYIEQPFRERKRFSSRRIFVLAALGMTSFSAYGMYLGQTDGFPERFGFEKLGPGSMVRPEREKECFNLPDSHLRPDWYCRVGVREKEGTPDFMVAGDSHAAVMLDLFDKQAGKMNQSGVFAADPGCVPLLGVYLVFRPEKKCDLLAERIFAFVKASGIRKIILVSRWTYYTDGDYNGGKIFFLSTDQHGPIGLEETRRSFAHGVAETIRRYAELGVDVRIVLQTPMQHRPPGGVLAKMARADSDHERREILSRSSAKLVEHRRLTTYVEGVFEPYRSADKVMIVDPADTLCVDGSCLIGNFNSSFYFDDDHLSVAGAARLIRLAEAVLQ